MAYVEDTRRRLLHLFERHSHQLGEVIDNPCLDPDDPCFSGWMEASVVKQAYNFDLGPGGFEMPMSDASFCEMVNDIFLFRDKTENCPGWLYIKSCAEAAAHLRGDQAPEPEPQDTPCPCLDGFVADPSGLWANHAELARLKKEMEMLLFLKRVVGDMRARNEALMQAQAAGADTAADAAVLKTDYVQLMNAIVAFVHDNRDL